MGERSPINDTDASGTFIGLRMDTTRADMIQAVLEGVCFAIRDSFEVAKKIGVNVPRSNICGGGSKSPMWRQMMANVLGIPLDIPQRIPSFFVRVLVVCIASSSVTISICLIIS